MTSGSRQDCYVGNAWAALPMFPPVSLFSFPSMCILNPTLDSVLGDMCQV